MKLPHYDAEIEWDDDARASEANATVTFPNGCQAQVSRHSQQSCWRAKNSPFTLGSITYLLKTPTEERMFDTFDSLMQEGLGVQKSS